MGDNVMTSDKNWWNLYGFAIHLLFLTCIGDQTVTAQQPDATALKLMSIAELFEHIKAGSDEGKRGASSDPERRSQDRYLLELIRRSGPNVELRLKQLLRRRQNELQVAMRELEQSHEERNSKAWSKQESLVEELQNNLDLLTTLRRVQKQTDPLVIEVKFTNDYQAWARKAWKYWFLSSGPEAARVGEQKLATARNELDAARDALEKTSKNDNAAAWEKQNELVERAAESVDQLETDLERRRESVNEEEIEIPADFIATTRNLPTLIARLTSADIEQQAIFITQGGDYRSGRHARWRIEARDSQNRLVPMRPNKSGSGGGMYQTGFLEFDESWEAALPMADYVDLPKPGDYTVTLVYHNEVTIADLDDPDDLENLLVFRSKPFKLKIIKAPRRVIQLEPGSRDQARSLIQSLPMEGTVKVLVSKYDDSVHGFVSPESAEGKLLQMDWQAVPELLAAINDPQRDRHQKAWALSLLYSIAHERDLNPFQHVSAFGSLRWQQNATNYGSANGRFSQDEQDSLIDKWNELKNEYLEFREAEPGPKK